MLTINFHQTAEVCSHSLEGRLRVLLPPEALRRVCVLSLPGLQWCPAAGDIPPYADITLTPAFTFPESGLHRAC